MSLYDKASLIMTPSGVKAEKLYSHKPHNGNGDFTHDRSAGTATRVNKDGYIETVAADVPRLNYPLIDGVVQDTPHFLLEPSRTNLVTYSEDLTTGWSTSAATVTADTQISPDGTQTSDKITVTGDSGSVFSNDITVTASTSYTFSFYVKRGTISDSETALAVRNQTASTFISEDISYSASADNWIRIEYTFTTPSGCTSVRLYPQRLSNGGQGTISVWGVQLEAGDYATSYIPTSGTTVTRNADVCDSAGTSAEFNDSEGVLYAEIAALSSVDDYRAISISDGTDDERITIFYWNNGNIYLDVYINGSSQQATTGLYDIDITINHKIAIKYKQNDFKFYIDGFLISSDNSGNTPTGLNEISFDRAGTYPFYGKTKEIAVFKEALTDSELEALTSWTSFNEMATGQEYTIR